VGRRRITLQVLVHEGDRHAALANCRRDAFDRAQAHITASENPHRSLSATGLGAPCPEAREMISSKPSA